MDSVSPPGPRAEKIATAGATFNLTASVVSTMLADGFLVEFKYLKIWFPALEETSENGNVPELNIDAPFSISSTMIRPTAPEL